MGRAGVQARAQGRLGVGGSNPQGPAIRDRAGGFERAAAKLVRGCSRVRGRKPKPTHLKLLEGNPGKRPLPKNEPKPRPVTPPCPKWLDTEAKREWRRVSKELERLGLLTIVDRAALAGYCQAYARWKQAEEILDVEGLTFTTPNGYVQQRPEVAIAQKSLQLMRAFGTEFGLTPSSRGRISAPGGEGAEDEMDRLLGGV